MIVQFTLVITWFIGIFLFFVKKQLPFLMNAIIYMITVIFLTNYTTVFTMNLHRFKTTDDPFIFISFILYREFIMPFIAIIFVNFFINSNWRIKIISLLSALIEIELIDVFMVRTKVTDYNHWSLIYEFLFNFVFLLFSYVLAKILLVIKKKEAYKI